MKTLIAPVDFSEASRNAVNFAAEISKRSSARLLVVHILSKDTNHEEAKANLATLQSELTKTFGATLACETSMLEGDLVDTIGEIIADKKPELVVMGTKGASGLKRILIGSNTVNVIANTTVPVLVIPEVARFADFQNTGKNRVVLATDLEDLNDDDALDILKELALLMPQPKIRVLNVRPKGTHLDYIQDMQRNALLSRFTPEIESERVTVFGNNVINGVNLYLGKKDDTGLVAMVARDTGALIQKHYTHEMASHTHLPFLVIHDLKA
jgi:nucleotide-binding universal stress UspA family protein